MARLLALDVGHVRIGVALSDPMGVIAQPWTVLERQRKDIHTCIADMVVQQEVACVVVGRPWRMQGDAGPAVFAVEAFVDSLRPYLQAVHVPIQWWDERLSTAEAKRVMIEGQMRRQKRRHLIDKVAAAIVLQAYLDAHSHVHA